MAVAIPFDKCVEVLRGDMIDPRTFWISHRYNPDIRGAYDQIEEELLRDCPKSESAQLIVGNIVAVQRFSRYDFFFVFRLLKGTIF